MQENAWVRISGKSVQGLSILPVLSSGWHGLGIGFPRLFLMDGVWRLRYDFRIFVLEEIGFPL